MKALAMFGSTTDCTKKQASSRNSVGRLASAGRSVFFQALMLRL